MMLPFPVALAVSSPLSGLLSEKYPARLITTAGLGMTVTGLLMFSFMDGTTSFFYIALAQLIAGCGSGTFQVPNNNTVISAAPRNKVGIVSSVNALARNAGMIMGIALSVAVYAMVQNHLAAGEASAENAFLGGYRAAMLFGAAAAVAGGILSAKRD